MNLDLAGKTALITGSSKGIGFAIAKTLHEEGCLVALNGRNKDALLKSSSRLQGSYAICGDVTKIVDARTIVSDAVKSLDRLDILVCNVGNGKSVLPGSETPDEWKRVFELNLWSATNMIEASRSALEKTNGVIVCISSICGSEVVFDAPLTYSAAKAALNAYIRGIARPLGRQGIRINGIAPGNILFEGSDWEVKKNQNEESLNHFLRENVALGEFGKLQDVANLVAYLASPLARFATGAIWTLDGGQLRS